MQKQYTVKLVYKDHPRDQQKLALSGVVLKVSLYRWNLGMETTDGGLWTGFNLAIVSFLSTKPALLSHCCVQSCLVEPLLYPALPY